MKQIWFLMIILLSLSCTSQSQTKRESGDDIPLDSLSLSDSISPTDTVRLLFVGDLMQHQGQINAAYAAKGFKGYDYSSYFEYVKEEIGRADFAIANLEVNLIKVILPSVLQTNILQLFMKQVSMFSSLPTTTASIVGKRAWNVLYASLIL